jgi:hypothetical protein
MIMRNLKIVAWAFILFVALADITFTSMCRNVPPEMWEDNEVVRWLMLSYGAAGAIIFRLGILGFVGIMACTKSRISWLVTPVWTMAHIYVAICLVLVFPCVKIMAAIH